jgi:putative transcriptional regulator
VSMSITNHPDSATLMSFAAGTLSEPLAAVVAAHAAMCRSCRREIADMELIGSALMLQTVSSTQPARSGSAEPLRQRAVRREPAAVGAETIDRLPSPIARTYGLTFATIPWKRLGPGLWHHRLSLSPGVEGDLRLLKIAAGRRMPEHGHGGSELTLVLDGAYSDETGTYRPGDMQDVDESTEHTPVADPNVGCVCIIASDRPARFKGLMARLVQPWTGI